MDKASIVVCTYQRPEALKACLRSLESQTWRNHEVIIRSEKGPLCEVRNRGLQQAKGGVVCFVDDDTVMPSGWLEGVMGVFQRRADVVGVSGPAIITPYWRKNRDIFRHPILLRWYTRLFMDMDRSEEPGRLCQSGAVTTASADATCRYEGEVDFLEACNMSFRTEAVREVNGFDPAYEELGEWSEPDLAFRIAGRDRALRNRHLWFTPKAALYHQPAAGSATLRRNRTGTRLSNYRLFASRWVKPGWRHTGYRGFLTAYYAYKELMCLLPRK